MLSTMIAHVPCQLTGSQGPHHQTGMWRMSTSGTANTDKQAPLTRWVGDGGRGCARGLAEGLQPHGLLTQGSVDTNHTSLALRRLWKPSASQSPPHTGSTDLLFHGHNITCTRWLFLCNDSGDETCLQSPILYVYDNSF